MDIKKAYSLNGTYKTGELPATISPEHITAVLGFSPTEYSRDESRATMQWGFKVGGELFGIWDYKGNRWSTYGAQHVFDELFGNVAHLCPSAIIKAAMGA